jgi:hypothetical protein
MLSFLKPKLPLVAELKEWVDDSFVRLAKLIGSEAMLNARVLRPTQEDFPDPYDGSEESLRWMLDRVAEAMRLEADEIEVTLFSEEGDMIRSLLPFYSGKSAGAAGLYYHDPSSRPQISLNETQLKNPDSLVATLAHELDHILLLRPGLVGREERDMEPLTDLVTVFLGLGVFTANSAFQFKQFTGLQSQGWSTRRQGYLPEEVFGYALARFAYERGESKPEWASYLSTNIASYFRQSMRWLRTTSASKLSIRA